MSHAAGLPVSLAWVPPGGVSVLARAALRACCVRAGTIQTTVPTSDDALAFEINVRCSHGACMFGLACSRLVEVAVVVHGRVSIRLALGRRTRTALSAATTAWAR